MDLIRDLLDMKVVDRNGRDMGRVDTVVVDLRAGVPPRIVAIELGSEVVASRVSPTLGKCVAALEHAFGVAEGRPVRIAFDDVLDIRDHVKVDVAVGETAAAVIEQRLRRWVRAIPGSS
jgi:sporulation protein YlmC with PRC-barrel domain